MDAEELLVHQGGQGEAVERLHAGVVHALGVLDLACVTKDSRWRKKIDEAHLLLLTLLLECEVLCEVPALMVAPQQEERGRVHQLQGPEVNHALKGDKGKKGLISVPAASGRRSPDHLYAEVPPVDVVPQEEVLCGCRRPADLEQLHEVVELAVDVAAHWERENYEGRQTPFPQADFDNEFLYANEPPTIGLLPQDLGRSKCQSSTWNDLQDILPWLTTL